MPHSDPTNASPQFSDGLTVPHLVAQVRPLPAAKGRLHIPQQQRTGWQRGGSALLSGLPLEGVGFPSNCY